MNAPREILPRELVPLLEADAVTILDVRTEEEIRLCPFPRALHVPLHELPHRHPEVPRDRPLVTVCHHGVRSLHAAMFLGSVGFRDVRSLRGGTDAWALAVDPRMPRY